MRNPVRQTLLLLGLLTVARMVFVTLFPPLDDEAYYWTWARHLAWGYPDHPPMIAYIIRAATALAGDTSLGIRLGPVLLALGTGLLLFDLGRRMFGDGAAIGAVWMQIIPVLAISAIFAAPDGPLGLFWILTLWCFWRALRSGRTMDWLVTGIALGMAMMSKLTAVFLALSLPAFLLSSPAHRQWLRRREPYLAALLGILVCVPLVVWNAQHDWVLVWKSLHPVPWTQLGSKALNAGVYTGAQLGYYGPASAVLLLLALAESVRRGVRGDERFALAAWAGVPIIAANWLASLNGIPKPHWPAPGYLVALLPAAALWSELRERRAWRALVGATVGLNLLIVGVAHVFPLRPTPALAGALWGWDRAAAQIESIVARTPSGPGTFLLAASYQTAAQLEYHTRGRFIVTTAGPNDAFVVRTNLQNLIGWNAVFINDLANAPGLPLERFFQRVESLPVIEIVHRGQIVRRFAVYRCYGFRGLP